MQIKLRKRDPNHPGHESQGALNGAEGREGRRIRSRPVLMRWGDAFVPHAWEKKAFWPVPINVYLELTHSPPKRPLKG